MNLSPSDSPVHGICKQEHWRWLSFPSPGDLLDPRWNQGSCIASNSLPLSHQGNPAWFLLLISQTYSTNWTHWLPSDYVMGVHLYFCDLIVCIIRLALFFCYLSCDKQKRGTDNEIYQKNPSSKRELKQPAAQGSSLTKQASWPCYIYTFLYCFIYNHFPRRKQCCVYNGEDPKFWDQTGFKFWLHHPRWATSQGSKLYWASFFHTDRQG